MHEFFYRIGADAQGHFPGHHRSRLGDAGQEFRGHVPLTDSPDARRLDLLASLRDPLGRWLVRVASERKAVPVYAIADLSASMGFVGRRRRLDVLADFVESLAWSAWRTGDAFGFIGADEHLRADWQLPLLRTRGAGAHVAARLRRYHPTGQGVEGLCKAHGLLRRERSLVFVLSDFHWPWRLFDAVLESLASHTRVPVVLWDPAELEMPNPSVGRFTSVQDAETGARRFLWLRRSVRERWQRSIDGRREALDAGFRRHHLRPLYLLNGFDAHAVTRYFHG